MSDVTATTTRISTGQTAGKTYHVQVRACNSPTRCSSWVESSGRTLGPVTAPGKVATPTVSIGKESLAIFWSAPSSDGGSAITGYDVQHKVNTAAWPADPVDDAGRIAGTDTTIRNLSNDTSYNVRVRACNANECGRWSDSASGTPAATALARPTGLNVVPIPRGLGNENGVVTARRALLSWDEVNGAEKYVIEESEDGVSWGEYTTVGQSTSKELVLDRLLFRTQVARFRVKAGKGQGRPPATIGDESAVVNVVDNPIVSIDGNSKDAGSNGPGVANIRWATVEGATSYSIRYRTLVGDDSRLSWRPTAGTLWASEGLTPTDPRLPFREHEVGELALERIYGIYIEYEKGGERYFAAREAYVWPSTRPAGAGRYAGRTNRYLAFECPVRGPWLRILYLYRLHPPE